MTRIPVKRAMPSAPRAPRRGDSTVSPFAPEIENLLDRAASLPHGLDWLHRAPLEAVSIALRVDARLVEGVRRLLDDPGAHGLVVTGYRRAAARWRREPRPECFAAGAPPPRPPPALGPEALLRAAEGHPLGLPFLADGPLETVAVTIGVHPFVVLEARALLRRRAHASVHR